MCTHLQRRGNRYFLRRVVPYGKREITKALGTRDRRTAAVLCRKLGMELDDEFREVRYALRQVRTPAPVQASQPVITMDAVQALVQALQAVIVPQPIPTQPKTIETQPAAPKPVARAVTLSDLADKWEAERQPDTKTVSATRRVTRRFVLPRDIKRSHVVAFKDALLASGQTGVNTNKQLTVLNVLLNFGVANGEMEYNPAKGVKVAVRHNAKDARHPFALSDLQAIFSRLPVYATGEAPPHIGRDASDIQQAARVRHGRSAPAHRPGCGVLDTAAGAVLWCTG